MAVTKITEKFTDKKRKFNSYIKNPEIFDCGDINIIKLFQYSIFREEGFNSRIYWHLPFFILNIILFLKRIRINHKPKLIPNFNCKILLGDINRTIKENSTYKSLYFENILKHLDRNKVLFFNISTLPSLANHDIFFGHYYDYYSVLPLTRDDKKILKELKKTFKKINKHIPLDSKKKRIFKEIIEIFWREYRTYREILKYYPNLKLSLMLVHYQNEGFIYAAKKQGIHVIELQHGLIAEEDMFYIYDKNIVSVRHKALFADEMWTYGEYWKNVLLKGFEYDNTQLKVFGYYLFSPQNFDEDFNQFSQKIKSNYQKIILVTAQKNLEHHIAEYINFLLEDTKKKNQDICIIIKPHPSATQNIAEFIIKYHTNVFIKEYPLDWLFQICDIHLSIYSTTLFDALRFNIQHNYALKHPLFSDYVENIVLKKVAKELLPHENIIDKINSDTSTFTNHLDASYFYATPNYSLIKEKVQEL